MGNLQEKLKDNNYILYITVILLLIFRFFLLGYIPLFDKTESRYAEIARIMVENGNWVVLHIDYDIPFWAKPPLSTWLSATGFLIFGFNEFASRIPSFLLNLIIILVAGKIAKKNGDSFYLPGFILLTMPEFLLHSGLVSTDTTLAFCVTLIMLSFWKTMNTEGKTNWNYLFFVGLGLGLLSKGPLVLVLTFPPLFIWCLLDRKRFLEVFSKFSLVLGTLITLIIAIPWYYFAEQKSPGFIDYFIIGEHYKRFLEPGWKGDLYGSGHSQPLGMIWVFLIAFAFPWIQIVLYKIWKNRSTILKNKWVSFLVIWLFWTPFFFTTSRNILHTYILPVCVPIMLLMIYWWKDYANKKIAIRLALIFPIVAFLGFIVMTTGVFDDKMNSDKYILQRAKIETDNKDVPLYYWKGKNYSGQFYSNGKAQVVKTEKALDSVLKINSRIFFVIPKKEESEIPENLKTKLQLKESNFKTLLFESK